MVDLMESPLLKDWLREAEEKGKAKGRAQGQIEEGRKMLIRLLSHKFGELPVSLLAELENVPVAEQLERLLDAAADAVSLDDFTKHLDR